MTLLIFSSVSLSLSVFFAALKCIQLNICMTLIFEHLCWKFVSFTYVKCRASNTDCQTSLSFLLVYLLFYIFWRASMCWSLLCLCRPFMIFEGCLNSNSECCRSKRARYQLNHPSTNNTSATHPWFNFISIFL